MDATSPQKKLEFIFIHHNLYGAKERIFETFGEIKKVWALSNFITPENSSIQTTYTAGIALFEGKSCIC